MNLTAENMRKTFGATVALNNVGVELKSGKIHALVGENGAGKSTFLKILAGVEQPDSGVMKLNGGAYAPESIKDAEHRGVALVFQEMTVNPSIGIAENIFIDRMRRFSRFGIINQKIMRRQAQEILDSFSAGISVNQSISSLDLGKWKCIEIARALSLSPSFLFLDESTAFLNHKEVEVVLAAMRSLRERGLGIAFVSHHLNEVKEVADSLTILKDGCWTGDFQTAEVTIGEIQQKMVGRDLSGGIFPPKAEAATGENVFVMTGIRMAPHLDIESLDLEAGEIVGIAGLKGSGGEEILGIIAGDKHPDSGSMTLFGKPFAPITPRESWDASVAHLPGDRVREGLLVDFTVMDNLMLPCPPRRGILFDGTAAADMSNNLVKRLTIKAKSILAACGSLSGGNMQKVVLGKCLSVKPRLLLLDNPTRGVDVGARHEIYRIIRNLAAEGMAILMVSEDMPELIGLCDRLLVLRGGSVTRVFGRGEEMTEERIIAHMA